MTIEMFRDGQEWRWRIRRRRDNRVLAVSADAYEQKLDCLDAIRALKLGVAPAPVYDTTRDPPAVVAV